MRNARLTLGWGGTKLGRAENELVTQNVIAAKLINEPTLLS